MSLGKRIRFFRNLRGMTQQQLGVALGFSEQTAHVRIAQYETNEKKPKEKTLNAIADILNIHPQALLAPNIDTDDGIMHILFLLEDNLAINADIIDGEICLILEKEHPSYPRTKMLLNRWLVEAAKYRRGEITKEEYDQWRYHYPELKGEQHVNR